ncbi:MAG TPA: SoxR reducing system RseC family protein [Candidatus Wunengus sp. YC60]|uniref:SoxR reducing system RseC family protein n=1 Tax=Candidatus Wunengus sp. YC60 TaxID=3367697 RepID=UPI00402A426C
MSNQKQTIEKGIIKSIQGNRATVEIIKPDTKECKSCGTCAGIENKSNFLEVNAIPGLVVGQQVTLQIVERSPYKSVILLLILPIISLLIGSLIGQKIHFIYTGSQDIRMLFCGFVFFALSIFAVSMYDKKIRSKKQPHQKIISIDILNNYNLITR